MALCPQSFCLWPGAKGSLVLGGRPLCSFPNVAGMGTLLSLPLPPTPLPALLSQQRRHSEPKLGSPPKATSAENRAPLTGQDTPGAQSPSFLPAPVGDAVRKREAAAQMCGKTNCDRRRRTDRLSALCTLLRRARAGLLFAAPPHTQREKQSADLTCVERGIFRRRPRLQSQELLKPTDHSS